MTNFSKRRAFSQSRQVQETGPHSSQQKTTDSLPTSSRANSAVRLSNLQSLTRGAASFLAARKLSSNSNSNTSHSKGGAVTNGNLKTLDKVASSYSLSEGLLDDLPCDFDDFSDDNNDSMCTDSGTVRTLVPDRDNPACVSVAHEEMDTSDVDVTSMARDDKTAPRESSFFNKLCEGTCTCI